MIKSKIALSVLVFALIVTTFVPFAFAATYNGNSTTMTFDVLAGGASYAPYAVPVNPEGHYCTRDSSACFQINNVTSNYNIQNVYFELKGSSYPTTSSPTITIPGSAAGSSSWWGLFDWEDIGGYDTYTVTAYAQSSNGNVYTWTKSIKLDIAKPSLGNIDIYSHGNYVIGTDGNPAVNNNISVSVYVSDGSPFRTSWIKEVSISVLSENHSEVIGSVTKTTNGQYQNWGSYNADFNLLSLGEIEKKLCVRVIATDYAGNRTTAYKYFTYDRASAKGYFTKGTTTATTVEYFYTTYNDASGIMYPTFFMWTEANGQDDLRAVIGQQVSSNRWRVVLNKANHNNESGLYHIHVWSSDIIGNFSFGAGTTYQMN